MAKKKMLKVPEYILFPKHHHPTIDLPTPYQRLTNTLPTPTRLVVGMASKRLIYSD